MDDQNSVIDVTPVDENSENSENQATVSLSLENLIKGHIATIERLQNEARDQKEMLDNVFLNDATFVEHSERAKEANKIKAETRKQIMSRPDVLNTANKLKSLKAELAEQATTLSELLTEFQKVSGMDEIENEQGEILKIVTQAKVVKQGSR